MLLPIIRAHRSLRVRSATNQDSIFWLKQSQYPWHLLGRQDAGVAGLRAPDDVSGIVNPIGNLDGVVERRCQESVEIGDLPLLPAADEDVRTSHGLAHDLAVVVDFQGKAAASTQVAQRRELVALRRRPEKPLIILLEKADSGIADGHFVAVYGRGRGRRIGSMEDTEVLNLQVPIAVEPGEGRRSVPV
jgi:hypothetical protein